MAAMVEWSPALDQVVHEVSVDFVSRTNMPQPIHIVQGDMTMPVVAVKLYKNGSPYAVPIAASGNVRWEKPKPSASYSYNPLLGLSDDRSTVYFEVTRQMSSVFGKTYAVVEIELGTNRRIASSPIPVFIDRDPIQPTDIEDTNEYETLLEYVAEAAASAESSAGSATKSANSAAESRESASRAATSEENAKNSENAAANSASKAATSEKNAKNSENAAAQSAKSSDDYAKRSKSYAVGGTGLRENEETDNAHFYYDQAKRLVEGLESGLIPMGSVTFDQLQIQTKKPGFMYNISSAFTTDATFLEGSGHEYPPGTNVYYTAQGYWDCLPGYQVTSVNGQTGAVKITNVESANKVNHKLTFTGGETGKWDGSEDKSVAIPIIPGNATPSVSGLMSSTDKTFLDGLNTWKRVYAVNDVSSILREDQRLYCDYNLALGILFIAEIPDLAAPQKEVETFTYITLPEEARPDKKLVIRQIVGYSMGGPKDALVEISIDSDGKIYMWTQGNPAYHRLNAMLSMVGAGGNWPKAIGSEKIVYDQQGRLLETYDLSTGYLKSQAISSPVMRARRALVRATTVQEDITTNVFTYIPFTPEELTRREQEKKQIDKEMEKQAVVGEAQAALISSQINTLSVDDATALRWKPLYPDWSPNAVEYKVDDKVQRDDKLYKCQQQHTSQYNWAPELVPAIWTEINETHSGTIDDPIPYNNNMALENGKYYTQDGVKYHCTRDTVNPVYNPLTDLVGIYVEVVQ